MLKAKTNAKRSFNFVLKLLENFLEDFLLVVAEEKVVGCNIGLRGQIVYIVLLLSFVSTMSVIGILFAIELQMLEFSLEIVFFPVWV